ncbi:hypothetical protein SSX86_004069 [Deinandra increscens subsp. villosa]|uniref:Wax synthase domain-containing protein n=1 Tax=Deinandra increscens subsp. villosa TaxID=3103831 RepID=A0AAP0DMC7_9ASTR
MEDIAGELKTFITIWFIAIASICYGYFVQARISHGLPRLLSLLPVITLYLILPLPISTVHLAFPTFFFLAWLANFKLLLLAFNRGPLASTPRLPIATFISIAILPINPRQQSSNSNNKEVIISWHKPILLAFKAVILILIVRVVYHYKDNLQWIVTIALYFLYMHIVFELGFAVSAFLVKMFILGFRFPMEAQFDEPYLATSLQNFWGRRWNLMASSILRATVYNQTRVICTPRLGRLGGQMVAIFVTFVVSGLMHELMYWYVIRLWPTWEVTWFFVLHGVCTAVEVAVKKAANGRFRLHRVVSGPVTMAFVIVTGGWLLFPQLIRNGVVEKIINEECSILLEIFRLD